MFEKVFPDGYKVVVDENIVALYDSAGNQVTNSNVDYYYEERGYGCTSQEEVANVYYKNFVAG